MKYLILIPIKYVALRVFYFSVPNSKERLKILPLKTFFANIYLHRFITTPKFAILGEPPTP